MRPHGGFWFGATLLLSSALALTSLELIQRRRYRVYERELSQLAEEVHSTTRVVSSGYRHFALTDATDVRGETLKTYERARDEESGTRWSFTPSSVNTELEHKPAFTLALEQKRLICAWSTTLTLTLWWTMDPPFLAELEGRLRDHGLKYTVVDSRP
ncbi:MAG TPA: hypothetical protein VM222_00205 [Planctomycetota bacterium]|nr:hypothetical protein [Planctomycetota bacterium]